MCTCVYRYKYVFGGYRRLISAHLCDTLFNTLKEDLSVVLKLSQRSVDPRDLPFSHISAGITGICAAMFSFYTDAGI